MAQERKKFGEVEVILGTFVFLIVELLLFLGIGLFLKPASVFFVEWWAWTKGAPFGTLNAKRIGKYIANILPLATLITFWVSVYMHNHPEKFGALQAAKKPGKPGVKKLKEAKQAKGTVAAVKEARTQYRAARQKTEKGIDEFEGKGKGVTKE